MFHKREKRREFCSEVKLTTYVLTLSQLKKNEMQKGILFHSGFKCLTLPNVCLLFVLLFLDVFSPSCHPLLSRPLLKEKIYSHMRIVICMRQTSICIVVEKENKLEEE